MNIAPSPLLQTASIVGRAHLARHEGGQDAVATRGGLGPEGRSFSVAAVADGCGSAPLSQVGAALLVAVATREAATLLAAGVPTAGLVGPVLAATRRALLGIAAIAADDLQTFVERHLLATLLVTADDGLTTTCFARGDGLFVVDDDVHVLDEGGAPTYLAYDLFAAPADPFVLTRPSAARVLAATDGLLPEHAHAAFGHRGRSLQRWLNVLADKAPLADDATVAVFERRSPAGRSDDFGGRDHGKERVS